VSGQVTRFSKFIDDHGQVESGTSVLQDSNYYYLAGNGYSDLFNGWRSLKLIKTDSIGRVIWMKIIGGDSIGMYSGMQHALIKSYDNNFILAGDYADVHGGGNHSVPYLLKFNTHGDTLWMKTFRRGQSDYNYRCLETPDHGIVMLYFSRSYGFGNGDIVIVKTDSVGNFLWYKNYGGGELDFPVSLTQLADGGFLIGGGSKSFGFTSVTYLVRADNLGNTLWDRKIGGEKDYCGGYVQAINSNLYITWSCIKDSSIVPTDDSTYIAYFTVTDSSMHFGTKYFYHNAEFTALGMIEQLGDSSFYSYGIITDTATNTDFGLIVCYDFYGQKKWERQYYYGTSFYNTLDDSRPTKDGGIVLTGTTFSSGITDTNQDFWFLKLDAFGCLTPDCQLHDGIVDLTPPKDHWKVNLYPNPTVDKATLVIENSSHHQNQFADILICNILGEVVYRTTYLLNGYLPQIPIDLTGKQAGVYSVNIYIDGVSVGMGKLIKI